MWKAVLLKMSSIETCQNNTLLHCHALTRFRVDRPPLLRFNIIVRHVESDVTYKEFYGNIENDIYQIGIL